MDAGFGAAIAVFVLGAVLAVAGFVMWSFDSRLLTAFHPHWVLASGAALMAVAYAAGHFYRG